MKDFKKHPLVFLIAFVVASVWLPYNSCCAQQRYESKYKTMAHGLVKLEENASSLPVSERNDHFDSLYRVLDDIILKSVDRVTPLASSTVGDPKAKAIEMLRGIDAVLLENNFVICIEVESLSDGLSLKKPASIPCYQYRPIRFGMDSARHHCIDCDLSSLIFYSIGQVLKLPLHFIEVPNHNFVRWRFSETEYFNWDNNTATVYTDDDFRKGDSPTSGHGFDRQTEVRLHYLADMTPDEITSYYMVTVAGQQQDKKKYKDAEISFQTALKDRPYDARALNNLSWMYLTVSYFKSKANYAKAYKLSLEADKLAPEEIKYRDTFSCACAAVGKFKKAIEIEKTARGKPERIKAYLKGKTCLDLGER